ncbi:hypothetical protein OVA10_16540 [Lelliottia sp. SL45]|uniref:hypothetical protein n=1 Tax=Lelliottia sp. SL45 TaxID=2994665 RepID=UPI002276852D|nr:hypothetical protein [Lelliottia sp. SL45]MCY1699653.1 hypothetical protein [Lelliottia sp. SL45]
MAELDEAADPGAPAEVAPVPPETPAVPEPVSTPESVTSDAENQLSEEEISMDSTATPASTHETNITLPSQMPMQSSAGGGMGALGGSVGIVAFIAFLVVIWAIWNGHNRQHDHFVTNIRATDAVGYQAGFQQKQLNDMQQMLNYNTSTSARWREDELRFGQPYGNQTTPLYGGRRGYGGGVINGSQLSNTETFAADNSVF